MNKSVSTFVIAAALLCIANADALSIEPSPPWQVVVIQADFIGTVRCVENSFTQSVDGTSQERVFVRCLVTDVVKDAPIGTTVTLDLGPATNTFGNPVAKALKGFEYFVIAYCKWGVPNGAKVKPPADYFLTAHDTGSWIPLPWSFGQTLRFMRAHGSDHDSLERFVADVRGFLARPSEERELAAIKAYAHHELREWFPLIDSESPTREQAAILNAPDVPSAIKAMFDYKVIPHFAETVLLETADQHALMYLQNEREPGIILPGEYLRKLAQFVEWRASSCGPGGI